MNDKDMENMKVNDSSSEMKMDHSKMNHADHDVVMADPTMAKEMEADMKSRFFISLTLTIPLFILTPASTNLLRIKLLTNFHVNLILFS